MWNYGILASEQMTGGEGLIGLLGICVIIYCLKNMPTVGKSHCDWCGEKIPYPLH